MPFICKLSASGLSPVTHPASNNWFPRSFNLDLGRMSDDHDTRPGQLRDGNVGEVVKNPKQEAQDNSADFPSLSHH